MMEQEDKGVPASPSGSQASPGADKSSPPSVSIPNAITFAQCGAKCEHDFFGPGSSGRDFDDGLGSERVCAKCGAGAMATTMWGLP